MGGLSNPGNAIIVGSPVSGNLLKSGGGLLVEDSGSPGGGGINSITNTDGSITVSTVSGAVTLSVDNGFHRTVLYATTASTPGNIPGTYFNGPNNDGIGATFTCTGSSVDIDGNGTSVNNTYAIKDQTNQLQNGLYVASSITGGHLIFTRLANFNNASNISNGDVIHVLRGATQAGSIFYQTSNVTAVGTSPITFANPLSGGNVIFANITATGSILSNGVVNANTRISSGTAISAGTDLEFVDNFFQLNQNIRYDDAVQALSVGRGDTIHNATIEAKSALAQTIAPPSSLSATLNMVSLLSTPSDSVFQIDPTLGNPTSPSISQSNDPSGPYLAGGNTYTARIWSYDGVSISTYPSSTVSFIDEGVATPNSGFASQDESGSGYTANGSEYNFYIYPYYNDGVTYVTAIPFFVTLTDNNDGNPFQIDLTSIGATGSNISGFFITRQINGGGFNDGVDIGNTSFYDDNNSGWTSSLSQANIAALPTQIAFDIDYTWGTPVITSNPATGYYIGLIINGSPEEYVFVAGSGTTSYLDNTANYPDSLAASLYGDYLANDTTRNYQVYTYGLDPNGNNYYSVSDTPISLTDDNSGNLYRVAHNNSGSIKALGDPSGSTLNFSFLTPTTFFIEDSLVWGSDTTVIPSNFGYLATGGTLNLQYDAYNEGVISGTSLFSTTSASATTIDPADSNYYYVAISVAGQSSPYRLLRSVDMTGAQDDTSSTVYDVNYTDWSGSSAVTPNSYFQPAGWFAKDTSSLTDVPNVIAQSTNPSMPIPTYAFKDNNGNTIGVLGVVSGALVYRGGSGTVTTIAPA